MTGFTVYCMPRFHKNDTRHIWVKELGHGKGVRVQEMDKI